MIIALNAVLGRELKKTFRQKSRLLASMVRPMIWLFVIGGGVGSIMPDDSHQNYQDAIIPGILGMTLLFGSMLSALSTVYDKESGVMRMLIISPMPSYAVILSKLASSTLAGLLQIIMLCLLLFALQKLHFNQISWILFIFSLCLTAIACAALGLITAVVSKSLDNFAAIMNFVIFPVFFLSGALYPVDSLPTILHWIAVANPFTYGVDLIKHSIVITQESTDFPLHVDALVLGVFSILAISFASWKFTQESTLATLINKLTGVKR